MISEQLADTYDNKIADETSE